MSTMRAWSRLKAPASVALAFLFAMSCSDQPTDPTEDSAIPAGQVQLLLAVNASATTITTLVVEVTAPDITPPLVFNIEVDPATGVATGTVVIPAGSDRTVTIRAFDANAIETHRGSETINVIEGTNPTLNITLLPLTGQQPVTASFGSFGVVVNPAAATVAPGATVQLTATVLDANSDPTGDAVSWATSNPGVASVDASGLVTANAEGSAEIVATFNGVRGSALVTVTGSAPAPTLAYVTNQGSNDVSVIDVASNTVATTISGGFNDPLGVAITPDGALAYVTNFSSSNSVSVIETASNTVVATISVGVTPRGVAFTSDGVFAYVTNFSSNSVSVIATASNTVVRTIGVGTGPVGVAITPDGAFAYVTSQGTATLKSDNSVSVIATATNTVVGEIGVGANPVDVAITPDGALAYVTNQSSTSVSVIETATNRVVATVTVGTWGAFPRDVAITPDGAFVYVVNSGSNSVSVIATATNTVVATVTVGTHPQGVAFTPDGAFAYVANSLSNSVSVIATATNTVVATIPVGRSPAGVAITP